MLPFSSFSAFEFSLSLKKRSLDVTSCSILQHVHHSCTFQHVKQLQLATPEAAAILKHASHLLAEQPLSMVARPFLCTNIIMQYVSALPLMHHKICCHDT